MFTVGIGIGMPLGYVSGGGDPHPESDLLLAGSTDVLLLADGTSSLQLAN
jgi:hypothetical protein